jgi:hypothetical protein
MAPVRSMSPSTFPAEVVPEAMSMKCRRVHAEGASFAPLSQLPLEMRLLVHARLRALKAFNSAVTAE